MTKEFDLVVVGAGPGGYVAAIRAAQLGLKVALVEKYSTLGGTCLNVGCIPSKALLDSSEHFHNAKDNFDVHGISLDNLSLDFQKMIGRKNKVVEQTTMGIVGLMAKNNIEVIHGLGSFVDSKTLNVTPDEGDVINVKSVKFIIATGSKPSNLPGITVDKERIITSTEALSLKEQPKKIIVIGAGVIGLELGSVFARIGTEVTVLEFADKIIPTMDKDIGKQLGRTLKKLGMKVNLKVAVQSAEVTDTGVIVKALSKQGKGEEVSFEADKVLIATGRSAFTKGLGLENLGIQLDSRGRIPVSATLETSAAGIYAIGDVIEGPMLAHKAEEEGVAVAEFIGGQPFHLNKDTIPGVVYTWPEAASVGKSEDELNAAGIAFKSGSFPFKASGRARASEDTAGFVKVLADATTDEILGVHMLGPRCADMIGECVIAMEYRASAEDIARAVHAHPTFSEAIKEAALAVTADRAIHA
jgi:dihydrolipoamide dehydrogenase